MQINKNLINSALVERWLVRLKQYHGVHKLVLIQSWFDSALSLQISRLALRVFFVGSKKMKLDEIVPMVLNGNYTCRAYDSVNTRLVVRLTIDDPYKTEALMVSGNYGVRINFNTDNVCIRLGTDNEIGYCLDYIKSTNKSFSKIPTEPDDIFNFKIVNDFNLDEDFKMAIYKLAESFNVIYKKRYNLNE
ncbi:hypothetical protein XaC1_526 [Xanthomonas phage XaC1]|nr:hypothetical protein XaC1_526 [Xanthomonas phage XaC1]